MTDDDAILKQLGARVREERAKATGDGAPAGEAIPAFDAAAEERIAARLLGNGANASANAKAGGGGVVVRPRRWLHAAAPLAAAAALLLFVATRGSSIVAPPAYEMSLVSANQLRDPTSVRTGDSDFTVDPDGELELVARPAAPVKDARARAFLVRSGDAKPWLVPLQISDEGAVRVSGRTRLLFPATVDPCELVIFVAVGDALPGEADAEKIATGGTTPARDAKYRVVRARIRFVEKK